MSEIIKNEIENYKKNPTEYNEAMLGSWEIYKNEFELSADDLMAINQALTAQEIAAYHEYEEYKQHWLECTLDGQPSCWDEVVYGELK